MTDLLLPVLYIKWFTYQEEEMWDGKEMGEITLKRSQGLVPDIG